MQIADIEPAVWRSLVLPLSFDLRRLHLAIQAAFNWWDCHLYEFQIGGLRFGDPQLLEDGGFEGGPRVFGDRAVRLSDFAPASDVSFTYVYDFGDDWRHTIAFEQLLALDAAPKSAGCVAGHVPDRRRMSAASADMSASWRSLLIWMIKSMPTCCDGVADTSTLNCSTLRGSARTSKMRGGHACVGGFTSPNQVERKLTLIAALSARPW